MRILMKRVFIFLLGLFGIGSSVSMIVVLGGDAGFGWSLLGVFAWAALPFTAGVMLVVVAIRSSDDDLPKIQF